MLNKIKKNFYNNLNKNYVIFFDKFLYRFAEHRIVEISASLAYFLILSIFPFLIALLNIINFTNFLYSDNIIEALSYLPEDITKIAMNFIKEIYSGSSGSLFSISVLLGLWSASNGFKKIIKNINLAYGFSEKRGILKTKLLSLLFTIALIIMILLLLLTQVFGETIINMLINYVGLGEDITYLWHILSFIIPFIYMFITFLLVYKYSPGTDTRDLLKFSLILPGAIFSTISSVFATNLFGYYVGNFAKYSVTYGSLGGIIILLIWLWLMSMIILMGGEINATLFSMKYFKSTTLWPRYESVLKNFIKDFEK
ncbi:MULTISPECIES: YihY/virulence factor BrkB family protein [Peptoniphilus]|uniref:YihY/virulence factor BrkB family protein n=1 Tax=Peptoniphilus TaxID=162289 RepID=UPI0001DA99DF|nr:MULTISPECIES: YihY/virulence factor BrkB family protein [Peptoniphilus]EFI41785.1 YihY family protein [Peptoniphilus sp. oral taxon 386 str. F0131]